MPGTLALRFTWSHLLVFGEEEENPAVRNDHFLSKSNSAATPLKETRLSKSSADVYSHLFLRGEYRCLFPVAGTGCGRACGPSLGSE